MSMKNRIDININCATVHGLLRTIHGGHQLWEMVIRKCGACMMTIRDELGIWLLRISGFLSIQRCISD